MRATEDSATITILEAEGARRAPTKAMMADSTPHTENQDRFGICRCPFTRLDLPRHHQWRYVYVARYTCAICGKTYTRPGNFRRHQRLHYTSCTSRTFQCRTCAAGFSHHACATCGKTFTRSDNLRRHRRFHCLISHTDFE